MTSVMNGKSKLEILSSNKAAFGIYNHAIRFHNTDKDFTDFWKFIIERELTKGDDYLKKVSHCLEYINGNSSDFEAAFNEIVDYLPQEINISTRLYLILGYDIGIVSLGNAFLNLGHKLFHEYERELLYFAMHEVHHVGYTHYNPISSFDDLKNTDDLTKLIKYSTHMEGTAVYSCLSRRTRENGLFHQDYQSLMDTVKMQRLTRIYFSLLNRYESMPIRPLVDEDWKIISTMSGGDRLWYVVGSKMAETIDGRLGRTRLNNTIIEGSDEFFTLFKELFKSA